MARTPTLLPFPRAGLAAVVVLLLSSPPALPGIAIGPAGRGGTVSPAGRPGGTAPWAERPAENPGERPDPGTTAQEPADPGVEALAEAIRRARDDGPVEDPEVLALLEEGLASLRGYEASGGEGEYRRAVAAFEEALEEAPELVAAHYGRGLALARGPEVEIPDAEGRLHRPTYALSNSERWGRRALHRAVELDPALLPAALELARLAVATRHPRTVERAGEALELVREDGGRGDDPALWLALSDVRRVSGDAGPAAAAAGRAVELGGGAPALHARGAALLRIEGREEEGAEAYLRGLREAGPEALARYFDDARQIFGPGERAEWDGLGPGERREWLRRFWEVRAAESAVTVSRRLAAHQRRLGVAHRRFRRLQHRGPRPVRALHVDSAHFRLPFDDRGLVYLRYGEPDTVVSTVAGTRLSPNESWVYTGGIASGGETALLNFFKFDGHADWLLGPLPPCDTTFYPDDPTETASATTEPYMRYMQDRTAFDPRLGTLGIRCFNAVQQVVSSGGRSGAAFEQLRDIHFDRRQFEGESRVDVARLLEGDDAGPDFEAPFTLFSALYAFRGEEGRTELVAPVLVPGEELTPREGAQREAGEGGEVVYPLRLALVVIDTAAGVVRRDTVERFSAREPLAPGEYARAVTSLEVPPADSVRFRIVVRNADDPREGQLQDGRLHVPDFGGDALAVSDVILAEEPVVGAWRRGDAALSLVPTHRFGAGRPVVLFYEIYGLPAETPYRTTIRVEPEEGGGLFSKIAGLFGGGDDDVTLTFEGAAGEPDGIRGLQEVRTVGSSLEPGPHLLTVEVENLRTGETASRETELTVAESGDGEG